MLVSVPNKLGSWPTCHVNFLVVGDRIGSTGTIAKTKIFVFLLAFYGFLFFVLFFGPTHPPAS
jgi:hypothetical protein